MSLNYNKIDDAVLETQNNIIQRGAFVNLATDLSDFVAVREMWEKRQVKFDGGFDWEFPVMMDHNHSARTVSAFETDGSSITDVMKNGKVGPRHINAHYIYDQREPAFQRGGHAIVDIIKTRYVAMMTSFYSLLEDILWSKPVDSSDEKTPFGLAYWVTKSDTEGFYGGNPAGFSDGRAGISTTAYPRYANWTAKYAQISKTDLIRKMRRAHRNTNFRSPVSYSELTLGNEGNGIYTNDTVIGIVEEIMESQNMNLGPDVSYNGGRVLFKSSPFVYAPKLNSDSTDPVYMIDWKTLAIGVMSGWENNLSAPTPVPNKNLVRRVNLDASLNMICTDLRRQAVISK